MELLLPQPDINSKLGSEQHIRPELIPEPVTKSKKLFQNKKSIDHHVSNSKSTKKRENSISSGFLCCRTTSKVPATRP